MKLVPKTDRVSVRESLELQEAGFDATKGVLTVRIIQPGFNKSKQRFYPADTLRRDFKVFEGAKMFADHQTEADAAARPEGSVMNWVASLKDVWAEKDGTLMGKAVVIDQAFKAKLAEAHKQGVLKDMGISIRAIGEGHDQVMEGSKTKYVESLLSARSVDFVTFAGAGGRVEAIESAQDSNDVDLITEADFIARRPDIVEAIRKETIMDEKQIQELKESATKSAADLVVANAALAAANEKIVAGEKAVKVAEAASALTVLLTASKLPKVAAERIAKQFATAEAVTGMKEAIDAETEYIKAITPVTKNNGREENETEVTEADKAKQKVALEEAFQCLGISKDQAKIAASI